MYRFSCFTVFLALIAISLRAADRKLLIYWPFDEGSGKIANDFSGNGLRGTVSAAWVDSPSGKAVRFDGTPGGIVRVRLPEAQRFGKHSWTFMAMLKPQQFKIEDRQNQRRIFAYGVFPDAYLVVDIGGSGVPMWYFCYKNENGKVVATGGSAGSVRLKRDEWAHVALVCDRGKNEVRLYVNGYAEASTAMRRGFDGDYALDGELTLGSAWHNYWGVMDEVKVFRSALGRTEIKAEVTRLKKRFPMKELPEAAAAERREVLLEGFVRANRAWASGDFEAVRAELVAILANPEAPSQFKSYAHLRLAQSRLAAGKPREAAAVYRQIAATEAYPEVHRYEARECLKELARSARGLPARDPAVSRTHVPDISSFAAELYVAPDGNDDGDGSAAKPFATLARARNAVRALTAAGVDGPVCVHIRAGEYPVAETLALTAEDSGRPDAPIVYRADKKGEVVFYGGARLSGFKPVTDRAILERLPEEARGKVVQCDLKALGISDYGELKTRGFGQGRPPPTLELYFNDRPLTLARWPNRGFVGIRRLIEPGSAAEGKPSVFEYDSDRPKRWTEAEDPWLFGYFRYLWADAALKIGAIDTEARTITTAEPYRYGGGGMSTRQGIVYYAFNLLEEIDMPGEWYLNRESGILYLYPPSDPAAARVEIGMLSVPMITMDRVTDVRFEGVTFDLSRYNGMRLADCERCLIAGCTIRRMAGNGITIRGGHENGILGCDIHTIGRRATEVIGGDRATLTPGRHFVENCRIYSMGRIDRTYTPAIQLEGVGNRVAHNLMYDAPSSVMRIEGNDHLVEFNEVHSAVRESDDQGAMELFRNPTYRGVIFRYNRFSHVGKTGGGPAVHGQAAIRFDDAISGMLVYGNVFYRCANGNFGAIQMNSGRDNVIDNNIFADCKQGISGGWRPGNSVWRMLRAGKKPPGFFTTDLYLKRYPEIGHMLDEPGINHVWRNVFYRCGRVVTGSQGLLDMLGNGVFEKINPGFANPSEGDFHIVSGAALLETVGFKPIPMDEIGLYHDRYRASWPVETTPVQVPDWRAPSAGR
ncbi:MAG: hypothetical protein GXP31_14585 [Kiritimatiellaeota bacterium]|nr:hypothetical protein [Kiritimatiellota bacterium]